MLEIESKCYYGTTYYTYTQTKRICFLAKDSPISNKVKLFVETICLLKEHWSERDNYLVNKPETCSKKSGRNEQHNQIIRTYFGKSTRYKLISIYR